MPRTLISVDVTKKPEEQSPLPHNRWHPDIPPVATVPSGDIFRVECLDCTGGQVKNDDSADDIANVELAGAHYLSGPIAVEGAEPGDFLVVDLLDLGALPNSEWGFTGIFDKSHGGGFLTEHYPNPTKAIWDFEGIYAKSRHIPGVRFPGLIHPGVIGCAPSHELLQEWNRRESELVATDPARVPPLACLPEQKCAMVGKHDDAEKLQKIKGEAVRTIPPREHGGNCDIKNLSKGTKIFLPVYVKGANLSIGDLHFSEGDGEISFCGAIEMAGWLDIKVTVLKGGMKMYKTVSPIFIPGPVEPRFSSYLTFEGISVDENGKQLYMDTTVAYRQACLNAINYLKGFGFTGEQGYLLLSAAPVEGRVSGIVDIPNSCCTVAIPTEIFDFDIKPNANGPKVHVTTNAATVTKK